MFGTRQSYADRGRKRDGGFHESTVTILTPGCHFSGKLLCRGSSRIGGRVEGEIHSEGLLILEEEAIITAAVSADEVVIQGQVKGRLEARSRVELAPTASFEGDIMTPSLVIKEGAQFNGSALMTPARSGSIVVEEPKTTALIENPTESSSENSDSTLPRAGGQAASSEL